MSTHSFQGNQMTQMPLPSAFSTRRRRNQWSDQGTEGMIDSAQVVHAPKAVQNYCWQLLDKDVVQLNWGRIQQHEVDKYASVVSRGKRHAFSSRGEVAKPILDCGRGRTVASTAARTQFELLARQFSELTAAWRAETALMSSLTQMCTHPAYQRIVGMGESALPFIFLDLQTEPDHWFWALKAITGCDPVPPSHRGDLDAMTCDWLAWGRSKGYVAP